MRNQFNDAFFGTPGKPILIGAPSIACPACQSNWLATRGHERWLRNIAVALGNGNPTVNAKKALKMKSEHPSALVREHVAWALTRLEP